VVRRKRSEEIEAELPPVPAREFDGNQVVAYNFRAARELRGWTQDETARRLAPYLGQVLPKASISSMERSVEGGRTRLFNAAELVAFARTFDLPVVWFLLPPPTAADYTLAGTARDLSFLVTLVWGRASQLDVIKERLADLRARSGEEVGGNVVAEAAEFPPELSWEHFSRTRQEALLSAVDAEANEIERMLGELGRVMGRFEKFSMKTFVATHPRQVYREISHSLIGEKVFRNVIRELDRQEPGRYDALVAAMGSPALERAFDLDDPELVERLGVVFDRVEEMLALGRWAGEN